MSDQYTNVVSGEVFVDPIQARRDEIMEIIGDKLGGSPFGLKFKFLEYECSGIFQKISGDRIFLTEATQIEIKTNSPMGPPAKTNSFTILDIEMDTFKVISVEDVKAINANVISNIEKEKNQERYIEDTKSLGLILKDSDNKYPLPITIEQQSIEEVKPIVTPVKPQTVMDDLPKQSESPEFKKNVEELSALSTNQAGILKGSKFETSMKKVLEKTTSSKLETRFTDLKSAILSPVSALNIRLEDNIQKIADAHNTGLKILLQKTAKAAQETRRRYKHALNETIRKVEDRLKGKTKSVLGSTIKSSKLQRIEKSLDKDVDELAVEIKLAKRYIGVKETLLNWVRNSNDRTQLTERQIETIVEGFEIDKYETACPNFINMLNKNTMEIIALILRELREQLSVFKTSSPHNYPAFKNIVIRCINSLIIMSQSTDRARLANDENVEELLSQSIDLYEKNDDSYFTPMKLFDIKQKLVVILDEAKPVISEGSESEITATTSSSTTSTSSINKKRIAQQKARSLDKKRQLDTLTPAIEEVKMVLSEYIPNIQPGEVLLTTAKQLKTLFGKKTGEEKEKHYYLDVNGKVRKIGSPMTYKLAINDQGAIPSQLLRLGAVKPAPVDGLSNTDMNKLYGNDKKELILENPVRSVVVRPPVVKGSVQEQFSEKTGSSTVESVKPKSSFFGSISKGFQNRFMGRKTAKATQGVSTGGRHRTRKYRKSKTHKKR